MALTALAATDAYRVVAAIAVLLAIGGRRIPFAATVLLALFVASNAASPPRREPRAASRCSAWFGSRLVENTIARYDRLRSLLRGTGRRGGLTLLDLFTPVVPEASLHPNFVRVAATAPPEAKAVLQQWAEGFVDRDNKLVIEFQTTFNSAFWELYLFAAFRELGLNPELVHHAPDFLLTGTNPPSVAEAVVASHAAGYRPEWDWERPGEPVDLDALIRTATVRLSNSIISKHRHYRDKYSQLAHVRGKPFILCVAPFEQPAAFLQNTGAIRAVLLGVDQPLFVEVEDRRMYVGESLLELADKDTGALIRLGLFRDDGLKEISAVIFSNCATWGKVQALGNFEDPHLYFSTQRYNPDAHESYVNVVKKAEYSEGLLEGLHVFPNPFASHPFDLGPFAQAGVTIHSYDAGTGEYRPLARRGALLQRSTLRHIVTSEAERLARTAPSAKYREVIRPTWREGELRATGSRAGPFVDNQLAHYRGWTVLVAHDVSDEQGDWLAQAREGLFYTVAAFTSDRTGPEFTLPGTYRSAGSAAVAAFSRIDSIVLRLDEP